MSTCTHESMTNHHVDLGSARTALAHLAGTVQTWRARFQQRRELAHWSERDMHDAGLSWLDVEAELQKPFWRA